MSRKREAQGDLAVEEDTLHDYRSRDWSDEVISQETPVGTRKRLEEARHGYSPATSSLLEGESMALLTP